MHWLTLEWWKYILDDSRADKDYGPFDPYFRYRWLMWLENYRGDFFENPLARLGNYVARCYCRYKGHGKVFWYNLGGMEPDMRCQDCGEDLG